ncbi:hypothetical protein [Mucilaginibacter mallensis]|uniref:hypothetical protein n=1 Tax=Mucilaginibacter mallensis TaxID=652787 RepID=UPI000B881475|nr:hypothetical protein [Mucilaginibacter mallensis]
MCWPKTGQSYGQGKTAGQTINDNPPNRHAELVSASHLHGLRSVFGSANGVLKQVQHDGGC